MPDRGLPRYFAFEWLSSTPLFRPAPDLCHPTDIGSHVGYSCMATKYAIAKPLVHMVAALIQSVLLACRAWISAKSFPSNTKYWFIELEDRTSAQSREQSKEMAAIA